MQGKLLLRLDLTVYSIPVALALYYVILFSGFDAAALRDLFLIGVPAVVVFSFVASVILRHYQVVMPFRDSRLKVENDQDIDEMQALQLKLHLMRCPRREAVKVACMWQVSMFLLTLIMGALHGFTPRMLVTFALVGVFSAPTSAALYYFFTEKYLAQLLRKRQLASVSLEPEEIVIFPLRYRALLSQLAIGISFSIVLGTFVYQLATTQHQLAAWEWHLGILIFLLFAAGSITTGSYISSIHTNLTSSMQSLQELSRGDLRILVPALGSEEVSLFAQTISRLARLLRRTTQSLGNTAGDLTERSTKLEKFILCGRM